MEYSKQLYNFKYFAISVILSKNFPLTVFLKLNDISASFYLFKCFEFKFVFGFFKVYKIHTLNSKRFYL